MSKTFFFIPGRNRELSLAELRSVIKHYSKNGSNIFLEVDASEYFLMRTDISTEEVDDLFNRLGGFIKYGEVLPEDLDIMELATKEKVTFGMSGYYFAEVSTTDLGQIVKNFLKDIKNSFKEKGVSSRFVGGGTRLLTSGQIEGNKLLEKGFELVVLLDKDEKIKLGRTRAIQDIAGFTDRDYEKPFVDLKMGVIPPKLARMMINLTEAEAGSIIWDPFCGSGNILLEALLLGYNVMGSDVDSGAVNAAKQNIEWLASRYELADAGFNVFTHNVKNFDKRLINRLRDTDFRALVFEPYMGPPQRQPISTNQASSLLDETVELYKGLIDTVEHSRKHSLRMVSVFPSYKTHRGWMTRRINEILSNKWTVRAISEDLHWERSNSIIRRNLVIADYKN